MTTWPACGRYLYADETATSRQFLANVAQAVEARGVTQATQGTLMRKIVDKLKGTNRPLFIDEAHRLPPDVLPRIRSIHDQAGVPIVMAGTHEILHRINDRSEGRGQFASRCIQYNVMEHIIDAEGPTGGPGDRGTGGPGDRGTGGATPAGRRSAGPCSANKRSSSSSTGCASASTPKRST